MNLFLFNISLPQIFLLLVILAWMYLLYEIVSSEFPGREGTLWALLVFFVPMIGALAYLAYGRSARLKKQ